MTDPIPLVANKMDVIPGSREFRKKICELETLDNLPLQWQSESDHFKTISERYPTYE